MLRFSSWLRATAVVGVIAVTVTACSNSSGAPATPEISPLANTEWSLASMQGRPAQAGSQISLIFGLKQASGFAGCNQFTTPYATLDTGLRFGPIGATRALCDPVIQAVEDSYFQALGLVTHWAVEGDNLKLLAALGDSILTYTRMAPATVEGQWNITQVNNGNQGVSPLPTGVTANMSFTADGTVQGFGGCNSFGGGYSLGEGDKIAIGPLMSSLQACGDPADTLERQLLAGLEAATKWSVTSGNLELRDDSGALQVGATAQ